MRWSNKVAHVGPNLGEAYNNESKGREGNIEDARGRAFRVIMLRSPAFGAQDIPNQVHTQH